MASPHAAGVAALVVGEGVTDPNMVEQILKDTARKPANQKYDAEHYGAGIIDAPAAIKKARSKSGGGPGTFVLGMLMAGAVAASARRKGLGVKLGWSYLTGVVVGASGLFFLPYIAPELSSAPVISTLVHGLPSWDQTILGPTSHGSALFFSALVPMVLLVIGYGVPKLRAPLAGLAIGVAAHLVFFAVVPVTAVQAPIVGIAAVWLALNAVACLLLARMALRR
jgi:serine protease